MIQFRDALPFDGPLVRFLPGVVIEGGSGHPLDLQQEVKAVSGPQSLDGFHLMFDSYKENVYSHYGTVESEKCFFKTAGDLVWERRGRDFFTTSTTLCSNVA